MTVTVKVVGAGSIGNHLANACRQMGWDVTIVDVDPQALERTKNLIYPTRYGSWDSDIRLANPRDLEDSLFDLVVVGTPPKTHLAVATAELISSRPKVMLIEKPLSHPDREEVAKFLEHVSASPTRVLVGYNQRLKPNTQKFLEVIAREDLGSLTGLSAKMLESWDGILKAHSWLGSAADSYLAYSERGGGALLEHSHALNLFLYFAQQLNQGMPEAVASKMLWVDHALGRYDSRAEMKFRMSTGIEALVEQDVRTWPAEKSSEAVFEKGRVRWIMGERKDEVHLMGPSGELKNSWEFPKSRPDDFLPEVSHLGSLLSGQVTDSPISLEAGVSVMEVALSVLKSAETGSWEPIQELN